MGIFIRKGIKEDVPQVLNLIRELAAYEKALDQVTVTETQMEADGFGPEPVFEFLVALQNQEIIGVSIYYYRYSTWKGKCLYLEDLVVTEAHRGKGVGGELFSATMEVAKQGDAQLLNWQVLDWNQPAINFYQKLESHFDPEWINCKLTREQIERF